MLLLLSRGGLHYVGFLVQDTPPVLRDMSTGILLGIESRDKIILLDDAPPRYGDIAVSAETGSVIRHFDPAKDFSRKIYRCLLTGGHFPGILDGSDLEGGLENATTSRNRHLGIVPHTA